MFLFLQALKYRNGHKFSERSVWANSTDPDQILEEQSDQGLHCLQFHLHLFDEIPKIWVLCLNFR